MYDIYENAKMYFPTDVAEAVDYEYRGPFELILKYADGSCASYDDIQHTIRTLPMVNGRITSDNCKKEFGYRLRRIMRLKGVTQTTLSERTGIPQSAISTYVSGKITPSFYKIDKIAKALNCSTDDFRCY